MRGKSYIMLGSMAFIFINGVYTSYAYNPAAYELGEVIVTGERTKREDLHVPAAVEIFDHEKIQQMGAENALDVVKHVAGFTYAASPTGNQYLGFRGLGVSYTAILMNGIPIVQNSNYDIESISTNMIERIEVVKGGSSVLHGSYAMGGVINIITKKENHTSKIAVGGGNQHKGTVSADVGLGSTTISYTHEQMRDYGNVYRSPRNTYWGDKRRKDSLNVQYALSDQWSFQYLYTLKASDSTRRYPNGSTRPGFHSIIRYQLGQFRYDNGSMQGSVYYRNRDWKLDTSTHQKGDNYGFLLQNRWNLGKMELTGGVEYEKENTRNFTHLPGLKRDSAAVFFMTDTALSEDVRFRVGAREAYVENSGKKFLPQFQVLYAPTKTDSYYMNINRSMRAPHVTEQWGTETRLMNPDLKAENGWNYELGWKKILKNQDYFKVDIFHMDINDRISSVRLANGLTQCINVSAFKNSGIELEYESSPHNHFVYNAGLSFSNPRQQAKPGSDWKRTEYKLGINWGIGYRDEIKRFNLAFNYMGMRERTSPMLNVDLSSSWKLSEKDSIHFNVYNLLDREDVRSSRATDNTGMVLLRRNWLLTWEHTF